MKRNQGRRVASVRVICRFGREEWVSLGWLGVWEMVVVEKRGGWGFGAGNIGLTKIRTIQVSTTVR